MNNQQKLLANQKICEALADKPRTATDAFISVEAHRFGTIKPELNKLSTSILWDKLLSLCNEEEAAVINNNRDLFETVINAAMEKHTNCLYAIAQSYNEECTERTKHLKLTPQ